MINILQNGNGDLASRRLRQVKMFKCPLCECVFEADKDEYKTDSWRNETYYDCACPFCGKVVRLWE